MAYVGLESINPATLAAFNKQQSVDDVKECVRRFHEHGIRVHGMFVFGGEGDTAQTIRDTVDFALEARIDSVQFFNVDPFTGDATVQPVGGRGKVADQRMGTLRWASRCFFNRPCSLLKSYNAKLSPRLSAFTPSGIFLAMLFTPDGGPRYTVR